MQFKIGIDAFLLGDENRQAMAAAADDRRLARARVHSHDGGVPAAVTHYQDRETPALLLVEVSRHGQEILEELAPLAEVTDPATHVVVVGTDNDIALYRTLLAQGLAEYMVGPVSARDILDLVERLFADPSSISRARTIATMGARGGAGASTVAHNLAWSLARNCEEDVAVIDLDIVFGTLGLAFNVEPKQTALDVLSQANRLDPESLERFMVRHGDNLLLLPAPATLNNPASVDTGAFDTVLDLVGRITGFVVLDLPRVWSNWLLHALLSVDEGVIVAQPDLANLRDAKALVDLLTPKRAGDVPLRLALNHIDRHRRSQLNIKDFQDTLDIAPTVTLPYDGQVFGEALNNGQMIGETGKAGRVQESFDTLAETVSGRQRGSTPGRRERRGMLASLMGR